jgi:hypothetical protein
LPLPIAASAKGALAISSLMILAWMTEVMDCASSGLVGLTLFWLLGVAISSRLLLGLILIDDLYPSAVLATDS